MVSLLEELWATFIAVLNISFAWSNQFGVDSNLIYVPSICFCHSLIPTMAIMWPLVSIPNLQEIRRVSWPIENDSAQRMFFKKKGKLKSALTGNVLVFIYPCGKIVYEFSRLISRCNIKKSFRYNETPLALPAGGLTISFESLFANCSPAVVAALVYVQRNAELELTGLYLHPVLLWRLQCPRVFTGKLETRHFY